MSGEGPCPGWGLCLGRNCVSGGDCVCGETVSGGWNQFVGDGVSLGAVSGGRTVSLWGTRTLLWGDCVWWGGMWLGGLCGVGAVSVGELCLVGCPVAYCQWREASVEAVHS